ncbi:MAG: hypothetical protein LBG72_08235, partial [Spirochaetaceae bacterium]|nr:hypothetical protein [Spirochaetaceae bacterium]
MSKQNLDSYAEVSKENPQTAKTKRQTLCSPAGVERKNAQSGRRFAALAGGGIAAAISVLLLLSGIALTGCDSGGGGGGDSNPPTDTRETPPASSGTDVVTGKQGIIGSSSAIVYFTTGTNGEKTYTIPANGNESGTYTFYNSTGNINSGTVVLKSNTAGDALVGFRYTVSGDVLSLTPALLISGASSIYGVELVSANPAAYSEKGDVLYESNSPTTITTASATQTTFSVTHTSTADVPAAATGAYWVITRTSGGASYHKAQVTFRLGGAYAKWETFESLPAVPPAFSITGYNGGEAQAMLYNGTGTPSLRDLYYSDVYGEVYSSGGIVWNNTPSAGTYMLYVMSESSLKKASVTIGAGGTGTVAWSAFTNQTEPGTLTINGYNGTAGAQVTVTSGSGSSMPEGIGTVAASGAVTWWFAPPNGTYYVTVESGSDEWYATGVAIAAGNGTKAWSEFIRIGGSLTISGWTGGSGDVYACSSNPSTTSQISSYMIGSGTVNSSGTVTWSSTPSGYSSYYIVVNYSGDYYKASVSSSTTTLYWSSSFSQLSSSSSSLYISGWTGGSATVYACSSNPSTTSQISSYMIGQGTVNSSGTVTWSSTPSGYS